MYKEENYHIYKITRSKVLFKYLLNSSSIDQKRISAKEMYEKNFLIKDKN